MSAAPPPEHVARFRGILGGWLGLRLDDDRTGSLAELLARRSAVAGRDVAGYLERLAMAPGPDELRALAREVTVGESYFFRNCEQFRALREIALPDRLRARADRRRLRFFSAGCAAGEEPYSLAIVMQETLTDRAWQVSIHGIDVNPAMVEKARRARYSSWALRETPAETERRWFRQLDREVVLADEVRRGVTIEEGNLADAGASCWQPEAYDIVFCRNVLMYFTPEGAAAVVSRLTRSLAPGGYLFLGHAETLRGLSLDYHLRHTHGTFYYQRKDELGPPLGPRLEPPAARLEPPVAAAPELVAALAGAGTWVEAIRGAAARIDALARAPLPAAAPVPAAVRPGGGLERARDLLRQERFVEALAQLRALPTASAPDPDALLLEAVLLAQGGDVTAAEEACRRLLAIDDLHAGAHYVLALCREGRGDRRGAIEHDQTAIYLDPGFAMPVLHLGLLARRGGDLDAARRELGRAVVLLQGEDPSRVLLFGGGFPREALAALCRAELAACGAVR